MSVRHFHIPGEATRREYAVYVMVARDTLNQIHLYVGKTGDNKDGCNPVISRAGNHFSYNKIHSQMRNHLLKKQLPCGPEDCSFDFFYATFGAYVPPSKSRDGIDVINEMERQLNKRISVAFNGVLNPYAGVAYLSGAKRQARALLATPERLQKLDDLVGTVKRFIDEHKAAEVIVETPRG